jgi:hypothetical protein
MVLYLCLPNTERTRKEHPSILDMQQKIFNFYSLQCWYEDCVGEQEKECEGGFVLKGTVLED